MTTTQVVETSVTVNNNNPIHDYVHPDDQTQPTFKKTPRFKPFTVLLLLLLLSLRPIFFNMHLLRRLSTDDQILEKIFCRFSNYGN